MIDLPSAVVAKLPVALGKVPTARMQLGHKQTQKQTNNKPPTVSKEKQQPQQNNHAQSSKHRLPLLS
jgi:hypothetical protein